MTFNDDIQGTGAINLALGAEPPVGSLIADCHIDLPPKDVDDSIDFEQFFRLSATLGQVAPDLAARAADARSQLTGGNPQGRRSQVRPHIVVALPEAGIDPLKLELALYMLFRQDWRLNGYDRGRIVNSFRWRPVSSRRSRSSPGTGRRVA